MYVNIRSDPWAYTVRPERRENENYKILVFSLLFFDLERLNTENFSLNFDLGFFWSDLATFYVSFGSFGLFWPATAYFLHKKRGHIAPLSGPSVTDLYSVPKR